MKRHASDDLDSESDGDSPKRLQRLQIFTEVHQYTVELLMSSKQDLTEREEVIVEPSTWTQKPYW